MCNALVQRKEGIILPLRKSKRTVHQGIDFPLVPSQALTKTLEQTSRSSTRHLFANE